jgi:TP901 family phage tail tape measure protein
MGNQAGKLVLTIELDDKGKPIVKDLKSEIKDFGKETVKTTKKTSKAFSKMWKQMAVGLGVTNAISNAMRLLTNTIKGTVKSVVDFEKEFANVTTLLDDIGQPTQQMRDDILALAGELGPAQELTKGLYQALSAGQEPAKAVEFVGKSAIFAKASLASMSDSVDLLTTILNAYGLEAEAVTDVSDVLFQVIKDGKTTGQELAASLGTVIPSAATLNINLREVGAAMAVMTKSGIDTRTAVTSLNAVMISIIKPTEQALAVAEKYGIELSKIGVERAGGLQKWLEDVKNKIGDNETAMATLTPNVRALRATFTLTGKGAREYAEEIGKLNDKSIIAGNAQRALNKQQKTFGFQMDAIKNKVEAIFIKTLLPVLQSAATWIKNNSTEITNFFTSAIENVKSVIGFFVKWKDVIIQAGKAWLIFFSLQKLNTFRKAFASTFLKMSTTVGGLGAKIKAIPKAVKISFAFIGLELLNTAISKLNQYYDDEKRRIIESTKLSKTRDNFWKNLTDQQRVAFAELNKLESEKFDQELKIMGLEAQRELNINKALKAEALGLNKLEIINQRTFEAFKKQLDQEKEKQDFAKKTFAAREKEFTILKAFSNELFGVNKTTEKSIELSEEQIKAIEEQKKAYESLNKTMGILTNKGFKGLQKESKSINKIWKESKDQVLENEDLTEKWRKKIDDLIESFEKGKKPIPEFLKNISAQLTDIVPKIGKTTAEALKLAPAIEDIADETKMAAENEKLFNSETDKLINQMQEAQKKIDKTSNSIKGIIIGIADMGIFSEKTTNNLFDMVDGVSGIFKALKNENLSKFEKFKAVSSGIATALGGIIGASDRTKQALQGIASGVSDLAEGFATKNPFKIIAGGIKTVANLLKLFSKDGVGEAIKRENDWFKITEQQTEQLRELEKQLGSTHAATSTMLDTFIEGNVTFENSDKWLNRIRETLSDVDQGTISATEAVDLMGKSFNKWLEQAKELGTTGSREFFDFVSDLQNRGLEVVEINDFIIDSIKQGFEGYKEFLKGDFSNATIGVFEDMLAWENKVAENQALIDGIKGLENALFGLSDAMVLNETQFDSFEQAARDGYDALISKGFTAKEALKTMEPVLARLEFLQSEFGLSIDDSTNKLIMEAKASGLLKPDPINRMADAMERFIELLTDKFGLATRTIENNVNKIGGAIGNLSRKFRDLDIGDVKISGGGQIPAFARGTGGRFVDIPDFFTAGEEGAEAVEVRNGQMRVTPINQLSNVSNLSSIPNSNNVNNDNTNNNTTNNQDFKITINNFGNNNIKELARKMVEITRNNIGDFNNEVVANVG